MDLGLRGRTALVSGSFRGTGQRIAAVLAAEGCRVLVHGTTESDARAGVEAAAGAAAVWGDLTTDEGADLVAEQSAGSAVDILVNNLGGVSKGSWTSATTEDWLLAYQTNVLSAQRLVQRFLPGMRERGWGRVVNLGTVGSSRPAARTPHYYAAKGALATLTASLAREVGSSGVTVNLVSPGLIRTPEVEAHFLEVGARRGWGHSWEEVEPHVAADVPLGRIATRDEVAHLVAFLASDLAGSIHGQNVRIDGGLLSLVG